MWDEKRSELNDETLRGTCPENGEILRCTQNDIRRTQGYKAKGSG
jgi:hypothetical protein